MKNRLNDFISCELKDSIKFSINKFLNSSRSICSSFVNNSFHKTLKLLSSDSSIKICNYDKGTGVVILNSKDYYDKLDAIVNDNSKFEEVTMNVKNDPILKTEKSICYYLKKYIKPFVDSELFKKLIPVGSQPGKLYGLAKVHKTGCPLRPVVCMIGTAEYNLAKYLDSFIKPNIPSRYMLNSTKMFLNKLKNFIFQSEDKLISFDVVSLYTNIPLTETIDIVCDYVYSDASKLKPAFSKLIFKKLLKMSTGGLFMFNGKMY